MKTTTTTRRIGARNLHARIVRALVHFGGFAVTERETTDGAHKAWLDHPLADENETESGRQCFLIGAVRDSLGLIDVGVKTIGNGWDGSILHQGRGFEIRHVDPEDGEDGGDIFVATYRSNDVGRAYAAGIDC